MWLCRPLKTSIDARAACNATRFQGQSPTEPFDACSSPTAAL